MKKAIVVNDDCGHAHVYEFNDVNMRQILRWTIEANESNTMMDDPEKGEELLSNNATAEEIESFMEDYNGPVGRSGGGKIHFVEIGNPITETNQLTY